ncbi:MAG: threonine-phosphate decarboxylase [bacterium]|nr:threonine-phosphate decarboxylase [bacterium]
MLEHGGKLLEAAKNYNTPIERWMDLSTGINPQAFPVSSIDPEDWAGLPQDNDGLTQAAQTYYNARDLLPVAGSQAAISALPRLRQKGSGIAILQPAYEEHKHAWREAGFAVTDFVPNDINDAVEQHDVVVLINPNNPTGARFGMNECLDWHRTLQKREGWLIVDEAFMDTTPEQSLVRVADRPGLIVLRSLGKFFGLAGARVGFVFAHPIFLDFLRELLGPWAISGPSRTIAKLALTDHYWQQKMRLQLDVNGQRLKNLLIQYDLAPSGGTDLFQWVQSSEANLIHEILARQAIWTRLFEEPTALRFGLPGSEAHWLRLEQALQDVQAKVQL